MTIVELYRKEHALKRELRAVQQEICEFNGHGETVPVADWSYHGDMCKKCYKILNYVRHGR